MKKKVWTHPKRKSTYTGSYERLKGERVFNLTNGQHTVTFESHQAAKVDGWLAE